MQSTPKKRLKIAPTTVFSKKLKKKLLHRMSKLISNIFCFNHFLISLTVF